ncbi:MAG TPA: PDZ domain-containing protein [Gemmatimonadaceae bacterium]|nr:PDZ domain-containing protein [Gemmatimonadaceae bacterium]
MRWLVLLAVPASLLAQTRGDTVSAPVRDIRYEVMFNRRSAAEREVAVAMTFTTAGTAPVVLSLPAWTPGAYELDNFARFVTGFAAETGDGKPLTWDKLDYDTWRVRPAGAKSIHVSFVYRADTLDNAMAWSKSDFLLFNGTNFFLYPEGQTLDFPATVVVRTETDWKVATGMTMAGTRTYTAANYHDLVDMPFFVGRFDYDSTRIADKWVRLATYPAGSVSGQTRNAAWEQLRKIIPAEIKVFGEAPWANYTLMQIVDSSYGGASGLEHQSSHVDVLAPSYVGSEFQPSLYAHEIFHSWNVKRLRPSEMWPYQYSHAQPTPWLWVSEGITDYYADLAEVRSGLVDAHAFYGLTAAKINEVADVEPISLEDASLSTWIHPVDGTGYIYYPKGSLAGLMLDIVIRDASDNKHSLDDVMRGLYQNVYKHGRGFTSADWWNAVSAAANGKSFTSFASKYIDGREPFPWETVLPLAGLRARQDSVPRLGVLTSMDSSGILVANVAEGSSAAAAGVRAGDYLISVGDIPVQDQQFGAKMRAKYGASMPGTLMPIRVRRGSEEITLAGKLQFAPGDVVVDEDPTASEKAVRIRNGILRGDKSGKGIDDR